MKTIKIACKGAVDLNLSDIHPFQGNLKDLSKENYAKLHKQILTLGFSEPISVWKDPKSKKWFALNGHQRLRVLTEMKRAEKYNIPKLPCSIVQAASVHEAKRKVLSLASQFGTLTSAGLFEFIEINKIDLPTIENFHFPEVPMNKFKAEFFDMPEKKDPIETNETAMCMSCGQSIKT